MLNIHRKLHFHLACGTTDLRKSIDGLTVLIQEQYQLDPFSSHLFVFCNRDRTKLKILHWEHNGFWLYYRRLEKGRFKWPHTPDDISTVTHEDFRQLLEGKQLLQHQPSLPAVTNRVTH